MEEINLLPEDLRRPEAPKIAPKTGGFSYSQPVTDLRTTSEPKPSRWSKILFWQKNKLSKPMTAVKTNGSVMPPAPAIPTGSDETGPKMHLPQNGNGQPKSMVEVDLAADKTLLFSLPELYYRLKVGGGVLLFVLVFLLLLYVAVSQIEVPIQDAGGSLVTQIQSLEKYLNQFEQSKNNIVAVDSYLAQINNLLKQHLLMSKVFTLLETNTLPEVYYREISLDQSGRVKLMAATKDFTAVAKQIAWWQAQNKAISDVGFSAAARQKAVTEGATGKNKPATSPTTPEIYFDLTLKLTPDFLTN